MQAVTTISREVSHISGGQRLQPKVVRADKSYRTMGEAAAVRLKIGSIDALIDEWTFATNWWRRSLGTPSDETVNWQPFNRSHSIAGILLHLADEEGLWIEEHLAGRPRSTEEKALLFVGDNLPSHGSWITPPNWTLDEYFNTMEWVRRRSLNILRTYASASDEFEGPNGRTTIEQAIRHLMLHEAYHAGQAALHVVHHGWNGKEPS